MRCRRISWWLVAVIGGIALNSARAAAQGGFEIEVYNSAIAPRKSLMVEFHLNHVFRDGDAAAACSGGAIDFDGWRPLAPLSTVSFDCAPNPGTYAEWVAKRLALAIAPVAFSPVSAAASTTATSHATHASVELVTGLTGWAEIGVYGFTTETAGNGVQWSGASIRPKVSAPHSWRWPIGAALSTELEYERGATGVGSLTWEIRPVLDKTIGRWYVSVNPTLEYPLPRHDSTFAMQFSPSAKVSFDLTPRVTAGIEYYGAYGAIGAFAAPASRLQQLYAAIDLHLSPEWELNAGVGAGMTAVSNQLVAKLIVGRRFSW